MCCSQETATTWNCWKKIYQSQWMGMVGILLRIPSPPVVAHFGVSVSTTLSFLNQPVVTSACHCWVSRSWLLGAPRRDWWRGAHVMPAVKGRACDARTPQRADWLLWGWSTVEPGVRSLPPQGHHCSSLSRSWDLRCRLCHCRGTGCMIRPQSLMSKQAPFCGVLGHAFMEFLKGPRNYCQAQHDLYEDKWTVEVHYYSTGKPP